MPRAFSDRHRRVHALVCGVLRVGAQRQEQLRLSSRAGPPVRRGPPCVFEEHAVKRPDVAETALSCDVDHLAPGFLQQLGRPGDSKQI